MIELEADKKTFSVFSAFFIFGGFSRLRGGFKWLKSGVLGDFYFQLRLETKPTYQVDFKPFTPPPPVCAPKFHYFFWKNERISARKNRIWKRLKTWTLVTIPNIILKKKSICTHQAHQVFFDFEALMEKFHANFGGGWWMNFWIKSPIFIFLLFFLLKTYFWSKRHLLKQKNLV